MKRLRFSLRRLLLVTVAVAGFCWYRDLPRQNANRFITFVEVSDYRGVHALLKWSDANIKCLFPHVPANWKSVKSEQSPWDWLRGRYPLMVWGKLGNGQTYVYKAEAIASGIAIDLERVFVVGRPRANSE